MPLKFHTGGTTAARGLDVSGFPFQSDWTNKIRELRYSILAAYAVNVSPCELERAASHLFVGDGGAKSLFIYWRHCSASRRREQPCVFPAWKPVETPEDLICTQLKSISEKITNFWKFLNRASETTYIGHFKNLTEHLSNQDDSVTWDWMRTTAGASSHGATTRPLLVDLRRGGGGGHHCPAKNEGTFWRVFSH